MPIDLERHLIELANTPGVAGYEAPIREKLQADWQGLAADFRVDTLGNLVAWVPGHGPEPRPRALVVAHMDEIGLMVSKVEEGFLRVAKVGGIDRRALLGQPVIVHGEEPIPGLIGSRPPHVVPPDERSKVPAFEDLVVDTGLPARKLAGLVSVGTIITFDQPATALGDGLVTGKALDNRASVAVLTLLLEALQQQRCRWDVLIAASVQEEVGLKGAQTLAWHTQPDLAIAIDVTFGVGTGVSEDNGFKLGGGPPIAIGPNIHPRLFDLLQETGKSLEMDLPVEPLEGSSGTDAWVVQISRAGVPTALVSIPLRNMHTPVEIVDLQDIRRAARLLAAFLTRLDDSTLPRLALDAPG